MGVSLFISPISYFNLAMSVSCSAGRWRNELLENTTSSFDERQYIYKVPSRFMDAAATTSEHLARVSDGVQGDIRSFSERYHKFPFC